MKIRSYYSTIRFIGNPSKDEFVNIGLLIFAADFSTYKIKFEPMQKIKKRVENFFEDFDFDFYKSAVTNINDRLHLEFSSRGSIDSLASFEYFRRTRANSVRLAEARPCKSAHDLSDFDHHYEAVV